MCNTQFIICNIKFTSRRRGRRCQRGSGRCPAASLRSAAAETAVKVYLSAEKRLCETAAGGVLVQGAPRAERRWGLASSGMREMRSPTRSASERVVSQNGYLSCGGWQARVSVVKFSLCAGGGGGNGGRGSGAAAPRGRAMVRGAGAATLSGAGSAGRPGRCRSHGQRAASGGRSDAELTGRSRSSRPRTWASCRCGRSWRCQTRLSGRGGPRGRRRGGEPSSSRVVASSCHC